MFAGPRAFRHKSARIGVISHCQRAFKAVSLALEKTYFIQLCAYIYYMYGWNETLSDDMIYIYILI